MLGGAGSVFDLKNETNSSISFVSPFLTSFLLEKKRFVKVLSLFQFFLLRSPAPATAHSGASREVSPGLFLGDDAGG